MKQIISVLLMGLMFCACGEQQEISSVNPVNWERRTIDFPLSDSLLTGTTYLSIYSQIYSQSEHKTHDLTATVSIRNTDLNDTIYIEKAEYFDTGGKSIRTYFESHIFLAPMETVEIVIDENDQEGGTGANFIFDWRAKADTNAPLFEGVMISTSGQQGLSFTTQGIRLDHGRAD